MVAAKEAISRAYQAAQLYYSLLLTLRECTAETRLKYMSHEKKRQKQCYIRRKGNSLLCKSEVFEHAKSRHSVNKLILSMDCSVEQSFPKYVAKMQPTKTTTTHTTMTIASRYET